jgi:hypothetical protein
VTYHQRGLGAVVVLTCVLAGCAGAGGSGSSRPGSTATTSAPVAGSFTTHVTSGPSETSRKLPSVGEVTIQRGVYGTVIVDRATGGQRFSLSGVQAGECLSFLRANPNPSDADVRAACPGRVSPAK